MQTRPGFRKNVFRFLMNYLMRFCIAGVVVYCCAIGCARFTWFSWHVVLCTLGYIPLMAEAFILFARDEIWSTQITRTQKYGIHAFLLIVGTVMVTAGNIDIFYYTQPPYHLYTVHGITGLISNIIIVLAIILGYAANYSKQLGNYARPVVIKFVHNVIGILGYVIGMVSLCYAYYTHWFKYYTVEESRAVALAATILVTVWSLNTALVSGYQQMKDIFFKDNKSDVNDAADEDNRSNRDIEK